MRLNLCGAGIEVGGINRHFLEGATHELSMEQWLGARCMKEMRTKKTL